MAGSSFLLRAELVPDAGTAALLRVVSVLHARCSSVRGLSYETVPGAARLTALVTVLNAGPGTLQRSLERNVEVLRVQVHRAEHHVTDGVAAI